MLIIGFLGGSWIGWGVDLLVTCLFGWTIGWVLGWLAGWVFNTIEWRGRWGGGGIGEADAVWLVLGAFGMWVEEEGLGCFRAWTGRLALSLWDGGEYGYDG